MKTLLACLLFCSTILLTSCIKNPSLPETRTASAVISEELLADPSFRVAGVLGDNMVIQRDKPFVVWGFAPKGDTIHVKASWNANSFTTVAQEGNYWNVTIPAAPANPTPQRLVIDDNGGNAVTLKNILIGEVWVCSGQSNMDMPVDSVGPWFGYEGVVNYQQEIADADWPGLRLIDIKDARKNHPADDISRNADWKVCNPENVNKFSAVAYFFGRKIMTSLNVPVGLVVSSVGGTYCEEWTSEEALLADPVLKSNYYGKHNSSQLYNGMINPLKYLSIKGFAWYQGENNRHDSPFSNYTRLNSALINDWRKAFDQGELPFYYVQMTPYDEDIFIGSRPQDNDYAFFREAQSRIRNYVNHTGMAVTMDAGDIIRIHPKDKKPVGERLGLLALNDTYGLNVQAVGPQFSSFSQKDHRVTINYLPGTAEGLTTKDGVPLAQYFFVAGTDKKFRKATAVISGNKILLDVPLKTPLPVKAVRYAFTNYPFTNLQNADDLPAEPFRTDNWNVVIETKN